MVYPYRPSDETFRWAMTWAGAQAAGIRAAQDAGSLDRLPATPGFYCAWCPETLCEGRMVAGIRARGEQTEDEG